MKMQWLVLPVLLSLAFIVLPESASAQLFQPIIPEACYCPGSAPDWGCVVQTVVNVMNIAVTLAVIVATVVIAWAGGLFIFSPLNPKNRETGRTMLLNAVVGLFIVLAAWIFVDFLMKALYNEDASGPGVERLGPWNQLLDKNAVEGSRCIRPRADPPRVQAEPVDNDGTSDATPDATSDATPDATDTDDDNDGVPDFSDNCPTPANAGQANADGDQQGPACEAAVTGEGPGPAGCNVEPIVSVQGGVVISDNAVNILKRILRSQCLPRATITSGRRTSTDQARVMYELITRHGVPYAYGLYGAPGDSVIGVYEQYTRRGVGASEIRSAMKDKILEVGPTTVSKHCSDTHDVFDVAPSSMSTSDRPKFVTALRAALSDGLISKIILPPADPVYHIEIRLD